MHPTMQHARKALLGVLSLDGTLSPKEQTKRTLFLAYAVMASSLCLGNLSLSYEEQWDIPAYFWGSVLISASCLYVVVSILCRRPLTTNMVLRVLSLQAVSLFIWDLVARGSGYFAWPLLVLIIDVLLVMQVPSRYTLGLVSFTVVWLVVVGMELVFRFGLLEMPGLTPLEGKHGRREAYTRMSDCSSPPCPAPFPPHGMNNSIVVFVIDFVVTRRFARGILKEQATMERTINTVQEIASLLAGYDVERVAELLAEHHGQLPGEMAFALRSLEENLRVYKAYLPKTCLPFEEDCFSRIADEMSDNMSSASSHESLPSKVSSSKSSVIKHARAILPLGLSCTKSTLLTLNIKDTLLCLEKDCAAFSSFFTSVLLKTLQTTDSRSGMVDVFVGDRIHCSFNASKQCANHATSALHTATMLMQGGDEVSTHVNMGVAMGKVLRGDMGCHVMRRFSMVGALVRDVLAIERAGRALGCDVLCNRLCFSDAECEHDLRLIPCKVELAAHCEPEVLGELLVVAFEASVAVPVDEWMYQIGGKKDWEDYNQVVRKYLKGETSAADVDAAAVLCGSKVTPVKVTPTSVKGNVLRLPIRTTLT